MSKPDKYVLKCDKPEKNIMIGGGCGKLSMDGVSCLADGNCKLCVKVIYSLIY